MSFFNNPEMLAPQQVVRKDIGQGGFILSSPTPLGEVTRCIGDWLEYWARETPDNLYLAERGPDGEWIRLTYAEVRAKVGALAQGLLDMGIGPHSPVVCLSDNGMDHALLMLATMHIGRPFSSVSSAYSRLAKEYSKITNIIRTLNPAVVYAADGKVYGNAIRAAVGDGIKVVLTNNAAEVAGAVSFTQLLQTKETPAVAAAFAQITPQTTAKLLLTSGSTGVPKAVINTYSMLCANQKQIQLTWPFVTQDKPVLVDWLPWSHTFGSNFSFNMILCNGGSYYIDEGRPAPGLFEKSVRNLQEIKPTMYFNVPRGFDVLVSFLEKDEQFARDFFSNMKAVFYAAAALPQSTWERVENSCRKALGKDVWFTSAWGATETSPLLTIVHWRLNGSGCIGLPVPGTDIKFLPNQGKLEMRVRGPQVFPGYLGMEGKTAKAFDEDGFYKIGDAGVLMDPEDPSKGIGFNGRVVEDFKLLTGTWVSVGTLRVRAVSALAPYAQDVVVTGHDRDEVGLLVFPSPAAKDLPSQQLHDHIRDALAKLKGDGGGSASTPQRALVLDEPPSLDDGEITDKGYINQRAVLTRRVKDVEALYDTGLAGQIIQLAQLSQ